MKNWGPDAFDDERFIRILSDPWYQLLVVLQDRFSTATTSFWSARGAVNMMLPITTGSVSSPNGLGSDSAPVPVRIRNRRTYLADSMQFMLEYGCRFLNTSCYYIMPSFRDEDPDETHLSEFFHSEAEIIGDLDSVILVVEDYLKMVVKEMLRERDALCELATGTDHLDRFVGSTPIPRLTFEEAVAALDARPKFVRTSSAEGPAWRTLTRAGEAELIRSAGGPVWVTHFDRMAVPFYQAVDASGAAIAADLLVGLGETVGAGQRHATGDALREAAREHHVDIADYEWYVKMKDRFPLVTSGFGVGVERFLAWALGHDDVRDLQLAPRHPEHQHAP